MKNVLTVLVLLIVASASLLLGCQKGDQQDIAVKQGQEYANSISRPEKIQTFSRLVGEYNRTVQLEMAAKTQDDQERAHMVQFYTFQYLAGYYWNVFYSSEREDFFADSSWHENLPSGMVLGPGGPLDSLEGNSLTTSDPRQDFENFLNYSFGEIDYQSMFAIVQDGSYLKLQEQIRQDLAQRFPK
ncbi:MAG: hypothetical protein COY66_02045 [Candidatus Kerfeldbacteria bacterium CG_4_10_14_0_8_um_filter_42_10]|uniref:Uncharacterized protein n=1 Tax=Candidatus Kerfeldbacteria bacterium CG_4_10_14_0_8_um_filter_42_10 TaxID=2014248 RepID=A0A2M7RKE3_9BACT|nr:MAG: hypothetical protein COY66_02045 [Candidatus Kerfeldbacteria bacterium CG_4_10_14_0_8_um_filter_42_10]